MLPSSEPIKSMTSPCKGICQPRAVPIFMLPLPPRKLPSQCKHTDKKNSTGFDSQQPIETPATLTRPVTVVLAAKVAFGSV